MTNNTIDDQLNNVHDTIDEILRNRVKFIDDGEWSLLGTPKDVIEELEQALYQDLMELVGEDEPFKNLYQWEQAEPINLEKQRIRQNINQYFGRGGEK